MVTDTHYSVPLVWMALYDELKGTLWENEDVDNAVYKKNHTAQTAASILQYIHVTAAAEWGAADPEESVLAVLAAARQYCGSEFLAPHQVQDIANGFVIFYHDFDEPMDDFLAENCGPVQLSWLNRTGRHAVEDAVCRDSEIWIDESDLSGVWVFNKPGQ